MNLHIRRIFLDLEYKSTSNSYYDVLSMSTHPPTTIHSFVKFPTHHVYDKSKICIPLPTFLSNVVTEFECVGPDLRSKELRTKSWEKDIVQNHVSVSVIHLTCLWSRILRTSTDSILSPLRKVCLWGYLSRDTFSSLPNLQVNERVEFFVGYGREVSEDQILAVRLNDLTRFL